MKSTILVTPALLFALLLSPARSTAQDAPPEKAASSATTADPEIPIDYLDLRLDPLTRSELQVEAEAWRDLVKAKAGEIVENEIAMREKSHKIAKADASPEEAKDETNRDVQQKEDFLEELTKLREEKAALLDRLNIVLDSWEKKGGDPTELRQYASAVSGIKVELTDTSATWTAVKGWMGSKEGGIRVGKQILQFLGIMLVTWILAIILGKVVRTAISIRPGMSDLLKTFINKTVRRAVLLVGFLVALSTVGFNVGALLALIGGGAFIIGFALQDTLGNFAAGVMLLFYRPFDVGDAVEVGGVNGKVDSVSLVSTTIRTFDNKVVLVPNKQVWGQVITNATASPERRVDMVFGIGYDDDVDKAAELLKEIVTAHELVLETPEPTIQVNELADSSVNFICRPWARTSDYWTVYWDITKAVKKEFDAAGISIPYPQQDVHMHQVTA